MEELLQFAQPLVSGAAIGCVYGLVALGFVLIYKATEVVNFAQGELLMVGAFLAILCTALFGYLLDRVIVRPIFAIIMVTFGIGFVSRSAVSIIPGWDVDTYTPSRPRSRTAPCRWASWC